MVNETAGVPLPCGSALCVQNKGETGGGLGIFLDVQL